MEKYHSTNQEKQTQNLKKSGKILPWILIGAFLIIAIVIGSIYFLFFYQNQEPSRVQTFLISESQIQMEIIKGEQIKFNLEGKEESHYMTLDSIDSNSASITIESNTIRSTLNIGEEKEFDLDNNGINDLKVKLKEISDKKAILIVSKIKEELSQEECFTCTEWDPCKQEGYQIRSCSYSNPECTNVQSPEERRSCNYNPTGLNQCSENADCSDGNSCTEDMCQNGACSNTEITTCRLNADGCCLSKCDNNNDIDCITNPTGDITISGELTLKGLCTDKTLCNTNCFIDQILLFNLENTFDKKFLYVEYDLYIDDEKIYWGDHSVSMSGGRLRNYPIETSNTWLPKGNQQVYIDFKKSVAGHKIKLVIDPNNEIIETNENNNIIEKTFSSEKMDISIVSMEYSSSTNEIMITIKRDKKLADCPKFESKLYMDGSPTLGAFFYGFNFNEGYEGTIRSSELPPLGGWGDFEFKLVVDTENSVDESNENNNIIIKNFTF